MFLLRVLILLASVSILIQCKTTSKPQWVQQHPVDQAFYIGIGIAGKIPGQPDHSSRARDNALSEIASNIAVNIVSESNLKIIQEAGVHRESFLAVISSQTKAELEGYELVDVWENSNEYRVFYRLSKAYYKELLTRKLQQVAIRAERFYAEGQRAEKIGDITSALRFYLQAASEVANYWGMGLAKPTGNRNEFIDTEIYIRLKEILSLLKISVLPDEINAAYFEASEQMYQIKASYTGINGKSSDVPGLPIAFSILRGNAEISSLNPTDASGKSSLAVLRALSIGVTEIRIAADLQSFSGLSKEFFNQPVFASLPVPFAIVALSVNPVSVFIETDEYILGKVSPIPVTAARISQVLTGTGWRITNNPGDADFVLKIKAISKAGSERMGVFTAFSEGSFSLLRAQSGDELLTTSASQVSGGGRDYESAARTSLERLADRLIDGLGYGPSFEMK